MSFIGAASLFEDAPAGNAVASERVRVGIVGVAERGLSLVNTFSRNPSCEVVALANLDASMFASAMMAVEKTAGHNSVERQRMVTAMKKNGRVVQWGIQARTTERMRTATEFIRTGGARTLPCGSCLGEFPAGEYRLS